LTMVQTSTVKNVMISCRLKLTSLAYKIDPIQFNFSNISLDT
jgi:hypothetical protein